MDRTIQYHIQSKLNLLKKKRWWVYGLISVCVGLPIIWPLVHLLISSWQGIGAFKLSTAIQSRIWFSLWQSMLTVVLSMGIGGSIAVMEHYKKIVPHRWFIIIMTLPIFLPSAIVAVGFIAVWGNAGYVNDLLNIIGAPSLSFLYSPAAIIASHCFYNVPLAYLAIRLRLLAMHDNLEESAQSLGAAPARTILDITLPRLRSTLIGISLVIFLYAFMSFALPLILGGIRYQTLEVYIYTLITQQFALDTAMLLASVQFIGLILIVIIGLRYIKDVQEKNVYVPRHAPSSHSWLTFFQFLLSAYILAPSIAVIIRAASLPALQTLLQSSFPAALLRTLGLAGITAIITLTFSLLIVLYTHRAFHGVMLLILAVSPITLGFAWRLLFGQSVWLLPIIYSALLLPVAVYLIRSSWSARPPDFLNTIKLLGASSLQQLRAGTRWLLPALLQLLALTGAFVLGDIAVSGIVAPYRQPTAMSLSYELLGTYRFGVAAAGMSIVMVTILAIIILVFLISKYYDSYRSTLLR